MKLTLVIILFIFSQSVYSQDDSVRSVIMSSAKLQLISEFGLVNNIEQIENKINTTYKCEFLTATGFDKTVFFIRLAIRPDSSNWPDSTFMNNNVYGSCEYILCYYEKTRMFYKIKGFVDNNVALLFQHLCFLSRGTMFSTTLLRRGREDFKFLLRNNFILLPRVDLLCLYDYWVNFKNGSIAESDCLKSCKLRELTLAGVYRDIHSLPKR